MLWLLTTLALADGDPHNPIGANIPPNQQDILATYDAAHTSRREVDTLLPLTYAFDRFAREEVAAGEWFVTARLAGSQAYGIGEVQAVCDNTRRATNFECAPGATTAPVPIDAMASTLEVGLHREKWSVVYVGSVNQLQIEPRTTMRPVYPQVYTTAYGALSPLLLFADMSGIPQRVGFPRSAHLVMGALHTGGWQARLGATLSLRPYLYLEHEGSDVIGEILLKKQIDGGSLARSVRLGLDDHLWGEPDHGRTTVLLRSLQLVDVRQLRNQTTLKNLDKLEALDLWWLQLGHDDIAGLFDVRSQVTLTPDAGLLEASIGAHTQEFHRDPTVFGFRGFAGLVQLPRIPGYAAPRNRGPTFGVETHFPWGKPGFGANLRLAYNDPQLVTRLPYSAQAVHFSFAVTAP
jgi:hypothetical protein